MPSVRVIGPGRAGRSLARALAECGWTVAGVLGRGDDVRAAARGVDVLVIATPDGAVADVAAAVEPIDSTLVLHMSGSLTLDPVSCHPRHGSLHPLASLPDPETGVGALLDSCPVAVAGDPGVRDVTAALGARAFEVPDEARALYHATAAVAANHVVALCAQVERLAEACGVAPDAFLSMAASVVRNAADRGAADALTGPAARGDHATIERHLAALPPEEIDLYLRLANEAAALAGQPGIGVGDTAA